MGSLYLYLFTRDVLQAMSATTDGGISELGVGERLRLFEAPHSATIERQHPSARKLYFAVSSVTFSPTLFL